MRLFFVYCLTLLFLIHGRLLSDASVPDQPEITRQSINEKYVLNEVRAVIAGPTETALILTLDIRPTLAGETRTLRDIVLEQLMLFDAQKFNVRITDEDIDRYLKQLQKLNNATIEQIEELFKYTGYTLNEGREQLKRKEIIEQLKRFRLQDIQTMPVNRSQVEDYWKQHAPLEEATLTLTYAFVPSDQSKIDFEKSLVTETRREPIAWDQPLTVKISELAQDKQFFADRSAGEIVLIQHVKGGFELTKVLAKTPERQLPLITGNDEEDKKRYAEIEWAVKEERIKQGLHAYECELLNQPSISIRFTHESDRQDVYAGCERLIVGQTSR